MSVLQNLVHLTEGIEGLNGIHEGIQNLVEANGALETSAAASQLAAELAITAAVTATVRTSMSALRLGLAVSGQMWKWEALSWAAGATSGLTAGAIIDWVNKQHPGSKLFDLLEENEFDWGGSEKTIADIKKKTQVASAYASPILLDLDGDGVIRTLGLSAGVYFDHAADGFAERTGWVAPGDGLLVWDRNANSTIDSGRELFGSETLQANGLRAVNGFEALKAFDVNGDGVIDASDPVFTQLRVWVDPNTDGRSAAGELLTLDEAGVRSIQILYVNMFSTDAQGNAHRQVSRYTTTSGQIRTATDVWFTADMTDTLPAEWVDVPEAIASLPDAQGYGKVRDLHQAMAQDASGQLSALVSAFTQADTVSDRMALVRQIVYRWTGVQDIDPTSRTNAGWGNAIGDARKLEALEEFLGEEWRQYSWGANPGRDASRALREAYDDLEALVYGQLMSQSHLKGFYQSISYQWDAETESIVGDLSAVAQTLATRIQSNREAGLTDLGDFLRTLKGMGLLNRLDMDGLGAALLPLGEDVAQTMNAALAGWVINFPTEGDDVLRGTLIDDQIAGLSGNDRLLGRDGNDTLNGGTGNDLLDGGKGNDDLYGGDGADTYVFGRGSGHDVVHDTFESRTQPDIVRFSGLNPADIQVTLGAQRSLVFQIRDTGETLTIRTDGSQDLRNGIGQYVFESGTVWSHDDVSRATVIASTEKDDVIHGSSAGDTLTGQAGNDTLIGNRGDDTLDGGEGNDRLIGSTLWNWFEENGNYWAEPTTTLDVSAIGNDTYLFGRGDGQDTVIDGDYTAGNTDTLRFKAGVALADVKFTRSGNDLVLAIRGTPDQVTLQQYFDESSNGTTGYHLIERIAFEDGTVLSFFGVKARLFAGSEDAELIIGSRADDVLTGQGGDDVLLGGAGQDILDGGAGNDVLRGGGVIGWDGRPYDESAEGDTYRFGRGDGNDIVMDDSWMTAETDRIELKAGLRPSDVRLEQRPTVNGWQVSDDLRLTIRDTGETLTVKNHFNESNRHAVEVIAFSDGTLWDLNSIKSRTLLGEAGDDNLRGFKDRDDQIEGGAGNDTLTGLSGNDTLVGGPGGDTLEGGAGADTYRFGLGDGQDVIDEGYTAGVDTIELAPGLTPTDITVRWTLQGGMSVMLPDASALVVRGQAATWGNELGMEQLRFADGTVWGRAELAAQALIGSAGDDAIVSSNSDDTLDGGSGNDYFDNLGGFDTYRFGTGDGQDTLEDSNGRVLFKPGIGQNDIAFTRDRNDLVATITASGDAIRIKDWLSRRQRIGSFDFDNGARLTANDVLSKLSLSEDEEILFGSPDADTLIGTEKDSTLYGREGNDVLLGGAGNDSLSGEAGDDTLDGGAGRDWLYGGEGQNTYIVAPGMGLDTVTLAYRELASDTVVFAPGIRPQDVSIQLGDTTWPTQVGEVGYSELVIGIGGNDALSIRNIGGDDLGRGAIQHFRFNDGTEWTLADVIARADGGKMGWQVRWEETNTVIGSEANDRILDFTSESATVQARGNDDSLTLGAGDHRVSAGSGDDFVFSGEGEDVVAGEPGNDAVYTEAGDDVAVFNYGDGNDTLSTESGTDTLSFGATIQPTMLSIVLNRSGSVVLQVDAGVGGSIKLENTRIYDLPSDLERIQFIDAEGKARIFNFAGWLQARAGALMAAPTGTPLPFDGSGFELTGTVAPAGGLEAVAYAQSGDLFATPQLAKNTPTDSDDVLYGTPHHDTLDAGAGDDIALGLGGDDALRGGDGNDRLEGGDGDDALEGNAGNDVIYGGRGVDQLTGGSGNDQLFGEWGGDTYFYQLGHGEVIIDDDHRVLSWGYGGEFGWQGSFDGAIVDDAPNVLSFGPGIRAQDLRYSQQDGDLVIEFAQQPGDRMILRGYESGRATQTRSVDIIRFADGTEVVARTIDPKGSTEVAVDEDVWLDGTAYADTLIGGDGDDTLNGQGGLDRLVGGIGSDTYRIHKQRGAAPSETLIAETWRKQDANRIEMTGEFRVDDLRLAFDGRDLLLQLSPEGDVIRFSGFDPRVNGMQAPIEEVSLPWQGVTRSFGELMARGVSIIGTPNADVLTGTALADRIEGRAADDTLRGGAGGDLYLIDPAGGSDTVIDSENGGAPNTLVLPQGVQRDDVRLSYDSESFLILTLDDKGNQVRLSGFDPQNPMGPRAVERFWFGINGDEIAYEELLARGFDIAGTERGDFLKGTVLTDRIRGGDGSDWIEASPGGDRLAGEGGSDTYAVQLGDGLVTIDDVATHDAGNVLRFGPGIDPQGLRGRLRFEAEGNGRHVMLIPYGEAGDVVRLNGFSPDDVLGTRAVDRFEFADGTVWDDATLVAEGFTVLGNDQSNDISGSQLSDRLFGREGDDVIHGKDGENEFDGGPGKDVLIGGDQVDGYFFQRGDGVDTIIDGPSDNFIVLGPGISSADVTVAWEGDALVLRYGLGDEIRIPDFYAKTSNGTPPVTAIRFDDGEMVSIPSLLSAAAVAQLEAGELPTATEDAVYQQAIALSRFDQPGAFGAARILTLRQADGNPLPSWLTFDVERGLLRGTPINEDVGRLNLLVEAWGDFGLLAKQTLALQVKNTNDAPTVGTALAAQTAIEDSAFTLTVPTEAFADVDLGDVLSYSATQADGSELPTWLRFDAATRTFSGTPDNSDVGSVSVRLTVSDRLGAQASQTFAIGVSNTNDAPEVGTVLSNQAGRTGTALSWQLPSTAFADTDAGDVLAYSATLSDGSPLPAWLSFDATTGTFSGMPVAASNDVLRVTATDRAGAQASQTFTLTVQAPSNVAPVTAPDTARVTEDCKLLAWGNVLANDLDPQGERLHVVDAGIRRGEYGVLTLLSNGTYVYGLNDAASRVQGLGAGETVTDTFRYFFSDGSQRSDGVLTVAVQGTNDTPERVRRLSDVQIAKGKAFAWRMPEGSFVDADRNDTLRYTATLSNGKALPSWLTFDAATQTFSGTASSRARGSIDVRVTASDGHGERSIASDDFKISFGNGTDVLPPSTGALPIQSGPPDHKHGAERDDDLFGRFFDSFKRDDRSGHPAVPALACVAFNPWDAQPPGSGQSGDAHANRDVERHWAALTHALNRLDAERLYTPAWSRASQGADLSGLVGWMQGSTHGGRGAVDAVSLACGTGTQLKGFSGIQEGLRRVAC